MMRLTWRQHRLQVLIGGVALVLLVPILLMTGREVAQLYQAAVTCTTGCGDALSQLRGYVQDSKVLLLLPLLPLLLGVFVGAPLLARELEQRTHLLCWTQSVSHWRWLAVKLGLLAGLALLAVALVDALMTWWSEPVDALIGSWHTFDVRGLVPFAYTLFALVLGIAAGTLIRQMVAAMASTLAVFASVRLAVASWLRPYYVPPLQDTQVQVTIGCNNPPACTSFHETVLPGPDPYQTAWMLNQYPLGQPGPGNSVVHLLTVYQPASRFWLFQGIETVLFLALTAALLALTVWWITRHVT